MIRHDVKLARSHLESRVGVNFHKQANSTGFNEAAQVINQWEKQNLKQKSFGWRGRIYQLTAFLLRRSHGFRAVR
jgi:hypothetical protein